MVDFIDNLLARFRPRRVSPTKALGAGGTAIYGGYVVEHEKSAALVGRQKYVTYSDAIANVSIVAAGVRYYLNLVARAGWKVEPAADSGARGDEVAEFFDDVLNDMSTPWPRIVRRASAYRLWGFSVQEWTAKRREDGAVGMLDVEPRPQRTIERWDVDVSGTVQGVLQRSPQTQAELYLPRNKIIYVVDDSINDSPEGLGLLRHVAEPVSQLRRLEQLEGWGFETDLRGIPIVRVPLALLQDLVTAGTLTAEEKDALIRPLVDFVTGHVKSEKTGLMMDSAVYQTTDDKQTPSSVRLWDAELMKGQPTSLAEVAQSIERKNREIARVLGVEQMLLGSDSVGSHALSTDKSNAFFLIVDAALTEVREAMQSDLFGPIAALNGIPDELVPELKFDPTRFQDVEQITAAIESMAKSGAMLEPDDPAINEVRDLLGISKVDLEAMRARADEEEARRADELRRMAEVEPDDTTDDDPVEPDEEDEDA